jgi:RHS repeat-associated protein
MDWNESRVSWSYQNLSGSIPWHTPGVGCDDVDAKSTAEYGVGVYATYGWISFNLKDLTGKWLNGDPNYGILLRDLYEDTYGDYKRFRSSEASSNKPVLSVTYQLLKNFFYIKDHLGNIRVTLDEEGSVVGYDDYYPFGMQMDGRSDNQGLVNNIYKYSSKELDDEQVTDGKLDWYYFGARYYDPEIGRWLRVDPLAEKYPSLSTYNYCANNPLLYIDPNGRSIIGTKDSTEAITWTVLLDGKSGVVIKNQHGDILSTHNPYDYFTYDQLKGIYNQTMNRVFDKGIENAGNLVGNSVLANVRNAEDYALAGCLLVVGGTTGIGASIFSSELATVSTSALTKMNAWTVIGSSLSQKGYVWATNYGIYYSNMLSTRMLNVSRRYVNFYLINKPAIDRIARSVGTVITGAPPGAFGPSNKEIDHFWIMYRVLRNIYF